MRSSRFRVTAGATLVLLLLVSLVIAGCGSSSSGSGSNAADTSSEEGEASSGSESGSDSADIAKAKELVAAAEETKEIEFPKPTESFDPGHKKVAIISCGNSGVDCLKGSEAAEEAAKAIGWTSTPILDGEWSPSKQSGFIQQAIQEGDAGIILVSIDAQSIKSAVDAAAAKHIPIACVMCLDPAFKGKVIDTTSGGISEGQEIGAWIVANSDGHSKIIGYDDKAFPIVAARREHAEQQIEELCPECEIENAEFPTTDLEKPGAPTFEAALAANPPGTLEFVMAPYDPAATTFTKAAQQANRNELKITGYDGSIEYIEQIVNGEPPTAAATSSSPYLYSSWAAMDQVARVSAGLKPWDSTELPSALITKNNGSQFIKTGGFFEPQQYNYKTMFKKLWGRG